MATKSKKIASSKKYTSPAKKAWATRRANEKKKAAVKLTPAQKAWVTRRLKEAQAKLQANVKKTVQRVVEKISPKHVKVKVTPTPAPEPKPFIRGWSDVAPEIAAEVGLAKPEKPAKVVTGTIKNVQEKKQKVVVGICTDGLPPTVPEILGDYSKTEIDGHKGSLNPNTPKEEPKAEKPETLQELFDSPEKWVQDVAAEDQDGFEVEPDDLEACKFCLTGGTMYVYGVETDEYEEAVEKLAQVIKAYAPERITDVTDYTDDSEEIVIAFNDDSRTTFEDIQRVARLANV